MTMTDAQYRAQFDAVVTFSNGGNLQAQGFRVDVPRPDVVAKDVGDLFVASLSLLMVDSIEIRSLTVFPEAHTGTRGGPSDLASRAEGESAHAIVDLSHPLEEGLVTYPGLPAPEVRAFLTREASRTRYAPGVEFQIDSVTMVGNTGTYLDSPYHRYGEGTDLAELPLASCVELPGVVVRTAGSKVRAVDVGAVAAIDVRGRAVLVNAGGDRAWGTPDYAVDAPYLTGAAAEWLVSHGAVLVGIDSVNIDDVDDLSRPAHSVLLAADVPVVEHLTRLDQLPPTGFRFSAAPVPFRRFATFPVRALAVVPGRAH
jgi:kynurenine formamidase